MLGHLYLGQTTVYTSVGSRGSRAGDEAVRPLFGITPTPWGGHLDVVGHEVLVAGASMR